MGADCTTEFFRIIDEMTPALFGSTTCVVRHSSDAVSGNRFLPYDGAFVDACELTMSTSQLGRDGFQTVSGVYGAGAVAEIARDVTAAIQRAGADPAVRGGGTGAFAVRDLPSVWPGVADVRRVPPLPEYLAEALSGGFGLVQAIYFDKPPGRSWAVPLHKDIVFPVAGGEADAAGVRRPTIKNGVPHAELPADVLERMLIARIHLDDVTTENGPLEGVVGSHLAGKCRPAPTRRASPSSPPPATCCSCGRCSPTPAASPMRRACAAAASCIWSSRPMVRLSAACGGISSSVTPPALRRPCPSRKGDRVRRTSAAEAGHALRARQAARKSAAEGLVVPRRWSSVRQEGVAGAELSTAATGAGGG